MIYLFITLFSWQIMAAPLHIDEAWEGISNPLLMSQNLEYRFHALPFKAAITNKQKFWSGDYWSMNRGSINYRWNAKKNFKDTPAPSNLEKLKKMKSEEIAQLSPAEKFDLLNGRYDFPLKKEVKKLSNYDAQGWEGICHSWAPAAMNHSEPIAKTLTNPDGVSIPFGSSDIKGILSYYYAYPYIVANTHQVGRRCDRSSTIHRNNRDCKEDLNAGAFHIILANRIGIEDQGFVADMDRFKQVWNHPVNGYESRVTNESGPKNSSAPGTVKTLRIKTTLFYASETGNHWTPVIGTESQINKTASFGYIIELNARGEIIGGEWTSHDRPDFLWIKEKQTTFSGDYARLAELLND